MSILNYSYWILEIKNNVKQKKTFEQLVQLYLNSSEKLQAVEITFTLLVMSIVYWITICRTWLSSDVSQWTNIFFSPLTPFYLSSFYLVTNFIYFKLSSEVLWKTTVIKDIYR